VKIKEGELPRRVESIYKLMSALLISLGFWGFGEQYVTEQELKKHLLLNAHS